MLYSRFSRYLLEAGCDEAGRGCLAGPVFAAAVILPADYKNSQLDDSKKLSEKRRTQLRKLIEEDSVTYAVASVDNNEIDELNILNASLLAMHKAIKALNTAPEFLIIDGNRFKQYDNIEHQCIVKGDSKYLSIAAASVLAKTYRDEYMEHIHEMYPHYGWNKNKGYPTRHHKDAIAKYGINEFHRKSFRINEQLRLRL